MDFEIQYKPGALNTAADALSRQMCYSVLSVVQSDLWDQIIRFRARPETDETFSGDTARPISYSHPGYSIQGGKLFPKENLVLPSHSTYIQPYWLNLLSSWKSLKVLDRFQEDCWSGLLERNEEGYLVVYCCL